MHPLDSIGYAAYCHLVVALGGLAATEGISRKGQLMNSGFEIGLGFVLGCVVGGLLVGVAALVIGIGFDAVCTWIAPHSRPDDRRVRTHDRRAGVAQ